METNTGSSSFDTGSAYFDTGADTEEFVEHSLQPELKLTELEYFKLMYHYEQRSLLKKSQESLAKDIQIKQLQAKVLNLEASLQASQFETLKTKETNLLKKLEKIRSDASKRLGISSLDPYMVDDETFALVHETDLQNVAIENQVKALTGK